MSRVLFFIIMIMFLVISNTNATVLISDLQDIRYMSILASSKAVGGVTTSYSDPFSVMGTEYHGVYFKLSGTTPNVRISIQSSYDRTLANFGNINTGSTLCTITSTIPFIDNIVLPAMGYIRFKYEGQTGNNANVTLDGVLYRDTKGK